MGVAVNGDASVVISIGGGMWCDVPTGPDATWGYNEETREFWGAVPDPIPCHVLLDDIGIAGDATITVGAGGPGGSAAVGGTTTCSVYDQVPSDCPNRFEVPLEIPMHPITGEPNMHGLPIIWHNTPSIQVCGVETATEICEHIGLVPIPPVLPDADGGHCVLDWIDAVFEPIEECLEGCLETIGDALPECNTGPMFPELPPDGKPTHGGYWRSGSCLQYYQMVPGTGTYSVRCY